MSHNEILRALKAELEESRRHHTQHKARLAAARKYLFRDPHAHNNKLVGQMQGMDDANVGVGALVHDTLARRLQQDIKRLEQEIKALEAQE